MIPAGNVDCQVPRTLAGERLDRALTVVFPGLSRGEARRLIGGGAVFVGGRRTRICSRVVHAGEAIRIERLVVPKTQEEPRIVRETADYWIVDKPAGIAVEPTRSGALGTLVEWLKGQGHRAYVTHRLDVATSGLVVLARGPEPQRELNALFAAHAIERRYLAVVASQRRADRRPAQGETFRIEAPLDGRSAVSEVEVARWSESAGSEGAADVPAFAAVLVRLETGRPRQIRRHLALEGLPVVGETEEGRRSGGRLLLHAYALALPWRGEIVRATSPVPAAFLRDATALGLDLTAIAAVKPEPLAPA